MSFTDLMDDVTTLRETNATNSGNLAAQKAIDASQEMKLTQLVTDVGALEHKVSDLANKTELLKLRV